MSPRYVPRAQRNALPAIAELLPTTANTAEAELVRRLVESDADARRGPEPQAEAPYGPESPYSYWQDLLTEQEAQARADKALESPILRGRDEGPVELPTPGRQAADLEEVRFRLRAAREMAALEQRDLNATAGSGGEFVPAHGVPVFIAEAFATAGRAQATLLAALPSRPLPTTGLSVEVPRFTGGTGVAVQASQNAAVQETDPTTALASSPTATIAGQIDLSRQLFDLAPVPGMDAFIAADLGAALGTAVDAQLVNGSGASGQTRGLENTVGTVAVTYTQASPTAATTASAIANAYQTLAGGSGYGSADAGRYLIVMHPRRYAQLAASADALRQLDVFGGVVITAAIPTNVNANQDVIYLIDRDQSFICSGPATFRVFPETGSGSLTVRLSSWIYVCAVFVRQPSSIARISGTGLVAPVL